MEKFYFTLEEKVITWLSSDISVEADNLDEAKQKAINLIKNGNIDGKKYELNDLREKILPSIDDETEKLFFHGDKIWDNNQKINQFNSYGQEHGYWEQYWENGNLSFKGNYVNGKSHGYWENYFSNGKLWSKGNFVNGQKDGYWEKYYSNGQLDSKCYYKNGKYHGYMERFSENGKLCTKGNYENGQKDGYWEQFNMNGNIFQKGYYENGKRVGEWVITYN